MIDLKEIADRIYLIEMIYNDNCYNKESFTFHNIFVKRGV